MKPYVGKINGKWAWRCCHGVIWPREHAIEQQRRRGWDWCSPWIAALRMAEYHAVIWHGRGR